MIIGKLSGEKFKPELKKKKKENSEIVVWLTRTHNLIFDKKKKKMQQTQISRFSSLLGILSSGRSLIAGFHRLSLIISKD